MASPDRAPDGATLHALARELYPLCRSITGDGVRETVRILQRVAPVVMHEVPTGTAVFDWQVPDEWNIRDAWVADARGRRWIDFRAHNLHVVSYSVPIRRTVPREELLAHLHTLPSQPDLIPYRTAYYAATWGFCAPHRLLAALREPEYDVGIDATLGPGSLTYGECVIPGATAEEVLLSAHVCHPSLCNDNLSSISIAAHLARQISTQRRHYTYRFLFAPGTIGAITWLALNQARARQIRHGLVLACLGDEGPFTYKRSRREHAVVDRVVPAVIGEAGARLQVRPFSPYGYDERQFCSPGFDLPVGRLSRSPHGEFSEYHTSADNPAFVTPRALAESYDMLLRTIDAFDAAPAAAAEPWAPEPAPLTGDDARYRSTSPMCEPQLGRRGLYAALGGTDRAEREMAMLWVLNQSDGGPSLRTIAARAGLSFAAVRQAAELLETHGLLERCHS